MWFVVDTTPSFGFHGNSCQLFIIIIDHCYDTQVLLLLPDVMH